MQDEPGANPDVSGAQRGAALPGWPARFRRARDHINGALRQNGVPFDISQIRPENLRKIIDRLDDLTIGVDKKNDKVKVKVFCEWDSIFSSKDEPEEQELSVRWAPFCFVFD